MTTETALSRLRAANPVSATSIDADELFARIVAAPAPAGGERRSLSSRRVLVLAVVALVAALAASTAYALSHWVFGDVVRPPVTRAEYDRAQKLLTLPPGYTWPKLHLQANSVTNRNAGGSYAVFLDQDAWECYWVHAIKRGDETAGTRAKAALDDLMKNRIGIAPNGASENWAPPGGTPFPYGFYADDGGYQSKQRMYANAAAGKPADLEQSCRVNGPG